MYALMLIDARCKQSRIVVVLVEWKEDDEQMKTVGDNSWPDHPGRTDSPVLHYIHYAIYIRA